MASDRSSLDTGLNAPASCAVGLPFCLRSATHFSSPGSHSIRHAACFPGSRLWLFALISALRSGVIEVVNQGPPETPEPGNRAEPGSIASEPRGMAVSAEMAKRRPAEIFSAVVEAVAAIASRRRERLAIYIMRVEKRRPKSQPEATCQVGGWVVDIDRARSQHVI